LMTCDNFNTDRIGGVHINWAHYLKVIQAKQDLGLIGDIVPKNFWN